WGACRSLAMRCAQGRPLALLVDSRSGGAPTIPRWGGWLKRYRNAGVGRPPTPRRPSCTLCPLPPRPPADRPLPRGRFALHLFALHFYVDPFGIDLGTAKQSSLDLTLELFRQGLEPRFDQYEGAHTSDTGEAADHPLGILLLERPLDLATQGDPALRDGHLELVNWYVCIPF